MTKDKLQSFQAWGMVTVTGNTIAVILSALDGDDQPLHRTLKAESPRSLPAGSALIAVTIETDGFNLSAHELGETDIASHPDVTKVISRAVEWIKKSAGL